MAEKRKIPFFDYPALFQEHAEEYMDLVRGIFERGAFILQKEVTEFETNLARYLGVKHAIGVGNCTDGLILALQAAGIRAGDEVILPSHTFVATASAIHHVGAKPVLADCGPDHLMDPESVLSMVTDKTRAIMPVQLNGRTCRMDALTEIAAKYNLIIVEDAAQSLGSSYKGRKAGTFGAAAALSFYPAKILGCFGDGGAVVTDDDKIAETIRLLRDHGRNKEGRVVLWGYNSRLDNLQAAVLSDRLQRHDEIIEKRRGVAALYQRHLSDIKEVVLPLGLDDDKDHFDVYQNFEIEAENRDGLRGYLGTEGVGTLIQWGGTPLHKMKDLGFTAMLPMTEKLFERCLMLPMYHSLSSGDVEYISERIRKFYG